MMGEVWLDLNQNFANKDTIAVCNFGVRFRPGIVRIAAFPYESRTENLQQLFLILNAQGSGLSV